MEYKDIKSRSLHSLNGKRRGYRVFFFSLFFFLFDLTWKKKTLFNAGVRLHRRGGEGRERGLVQPNRIYPSISRFNRIHNNRMDPFEGEEI